MNKVNLKDLIQDDLNSIKTEIFKSPEAFVQTLFNSIRLFTHFSAYKIGLSLNYLKHVYEKAFPFVKHGGDRVSRTKDFLEPAQKSLQKQVAPDASWSKRVSLAERTIIINLFNDIKRVKKFPNFVELVGLRSKLLNNKISSRAIHNRIRIGSYIVNSEKLDKNTALFRNNMILFTKFLKIVIREERRKKKKENETREKLV